MAKLKRSSVIAVAPADSAQAPVPAPPVVPVTATASMPVTVPARVIPAVASAASVPFVVAAPGSQAVVNNVGRPNLVQKRQAKIAAAIVNKTFALRELRNGQPFSCICGAEGKNAIVLIAIDKTTGAQTEMLVGSTCLKYTGITLPKQPRVARTVTAPGVSKQQKVAATLAKHAAPFHFVRKQEGPFVCICGGRGTNQVVIADANGAEFSVGRTCAEAIPGVEVPKPEKVVTGAPVVAGLKGAVPTQPPAFHNVA